MTNNLEKIFFETKHNFIQRICSKKKLTAGELLIWKMAELRTAIKNVKIVSKYRSVPKNAFC